jgi:hypothetical protein
MQKKVTGDRRREYRHKVRIDVKVIAPKSSFWAVANNISGGGMEIQTPSPVNPGTKLMTAMQLQEEFVFHGTVVWTLGDYVDNQWIYRVGIKTEMISFRNMSASTTQEKAELVKRILPQIKARGAEDSPLIEMSA